MPHPEYTNWPDDIKNFYNKIRDGIKKNGYVIQGTVDGKAELERPFAYTIGASFDIGAEFLCFFPIKDKGLSIISAILNRIVDSVKNGTRSLNSQIIDDNHIYNLPVAMLVLEEEVKKDIESVWPKQLERDGILAEFSTNDHKLILLICTDKNGYFPWQEECEGYWPKICPPPLVAIAQQELTGDDSLLCSLEKKQLKTNTKTKKNMELNEKKIKKLTSKLSTPLSGLSFVFLAYALFTDREAKEEEVKQALKNTFALGKLWEYNNEEMKEAFMTAQTVLGECEMEEVEAIFVDILAKFHFQEGFENKQKEWVVAAFELIMDADGEKNERELYWIDKIKEFWQLS